MFDLVMFDLDGTLVDTAGEIADTVNDVLRSVSVREVPDDMVSRWIGQGSRELLCRAWAYATGLPEAQVRESNGMDALAAKYARFHESRCGTRSTCFPAAAESLQALRADGVALALITNREQRLAEAVLTAHQLREYFDTIIAGDTLTARKPDPLPVRHCLSRHGVRPERALMVGDSRYDVLTAHRAGVRCWAVPYGYNGGEPITEANPDRVIDDLSALVELLCAAPAQPSIGGLRA